MANGNKGDGNRDNGYIVKKREFVKNFTHRHFDPDTPFGNHFFLNRLVVHDN